MFKRYKKLKIFALMLLGLMIALITVTVVSFPNQRERYLGYIQNYTPPPYQECMTAYITQHWDSIFQKYDKDVMEGRIRPARLENEVVKEIVYEYLPICKNVTLP